MNFTDKVRARLTDINVQESLRVASIDILPVMRKRIFDEGKDRDGNSIGSYSTAPIYISKKEMSRTGGGRETKGGKTKYFEGGYKAYKQSLGRGEKFDLRNFGVMMRDFLAPQETVSGFSLKYTFKQKRSENIAENYPLAWGLSKSEIDIVQKTFTFELAKRLFI